MSTLEVHRHVQRLDLLFERVGKLDPADPNVALLTQYLCVRVAGLVEQASRHIYREHARLRASPTMARFVSETLDRPRNLNTQPLCQLVGRFSPNWREDLEVFVNTNGRKEALDSIVANRNLIAHGQTCGVGLHQVKEWYKRVLEIVNFLDNQANPEGQA